MSATPTPAEAVEATETAAAPSVSWRRRALRRTAGSLGAAVVLAGIAPAIANAAGADVANPVAIALRASSDGLSSVFGTEDEQTVAPCVDPSAEPSVEPSAEPSAEPTAEPSVEPSVDPSASVDPQPGTEPSADPSESVDPSAAPDETVSAEPTAEPSLDPSAVPSVSEEPSDDCVETTEETPSPTPSETETEDAEDGTHGQIVSTVARCAPKGKDPLLDVEGAPGNHGGYVKVAAHGDTLTLPWGEYDLSTQAGADALCASLDAARADLPAEAEVDDEKPGKGKKDKAERGRPDKPAKDKGGKHARGDSEGDAEG